MQSLRAWRPVALAHSLGNAPLCIALEDLALVLFRDGAGRIGALEDRCLHRGMRLSNGNVADGRLTCPYHGWSYCADGIARSPGSPALHLQAQAFETATRAGLIWLREAGGTDVLPDDEEPGLELIHSLSCMVEAPVASVIDNFTEVEHTGAAHWQFGYDPRRLAEIDVTMDADADSIRMRATGPQRPLLPYTRLGFGIPDGMRLICEWDTSFTPPRSVWRWHWRDPRTGQVRGRRFKAVAYFNAVRPTRTQLLTYYYWSGAPIDRFGFARLAKPLIRLATRYEMALDVASIEGLSANGRGIPPTGASRFDCGLVEQRLRLAATGAPQPGTRPTRSE